MKSVIYCSEMVRNRGRRFGSAQGYYPALLRGPASQDMPLLFTQDEINRALRRAASNPEDVPMVKKRPWWQIW